jgi:hypothetical protein
MMQRSYSKKKGGHLLNNNSVFLLQKFFRAPLWRQAAVLAVLAALLILPAASEAVDLTGTSSTYLQSRKTANGDQLLPLYEYLNFSVNNNVGKDSISFQFGGAVRYDLNNNEVFGKDTNSDLQYAYLSYRAAESNAIVNLGRVMVFEGVAAERVDGVYARTDLQSNFGISAFGGSPVETEINEPGNNMIYGARLSHQMPGIYRIGISALKEEKNSEDFRKEEGIDLWLHPVNKVELLGKSNYNAITNDWMEHTYLLVLGPFEKLRLNTTASWIDYKSFFGLLDAATGRSSATTPVFNFQPGILDPNEKVRSLGEEVAYGVTDKLNISVDYKGYAYSIAGNAKYYGGNFRYADAPGGAGLSLHRMDGETDRLKYYEYRIYGYTKLGTINVSLDVIDVNYDSAINGVSNAYSVSFAAVYDLTEKLKVGADVEYSKNPDFDKDVRAFLKVIYRFDLGYGNRKGV